MKNFDGWPIFGWLFAVPALLEAFERPSASAALAICAILCFGFGGVIRAIKTTS